MRLLDVMTVSRIVIALVAAASSLALAVACSSSSTGGGGATVSSPDPNHPVTRCGAPTCKAGELDAYNACVQERCEGQYKKCLGDNYKSGTLTGACGPHFTCLNACDCSDSECRLKCTLNDECLKCYVEDIAPCEQGCPLPACTKVSTFDGG